MLLLLPLLSLSLESRAATLFNDLVSLEIPASFVLLPAAPAPDGTLIKTESHQYLSKAGTSFSVSLMSGNEEVGDLEKAGMPLEDIASDDCRPDAEKSRQELVIAGLKTLHTACAFQAHGTPLKQFTLALFVNGKALMFHALGKASEESEMESLLAAVKNATLRRDAR